MKNFAIIGLGNFGAAVARELSRSKCRVTAVDIDKAKVIPVDEYAHLAILADATERKFLENLEVDTYDCFVVSTGKDSHAAILITLHLKELGAKRIIVKANSADHARILLKVGASEAVIPEEQMAVRLSHSLARTNLVDYLPLSGDFYVAELAPPEQFIDKRLLDLQLRNQYHVQVIAVKDANSDAINFAPGGNYVIKKNDLLVLLGKEEDIEKIK
ncbi:MAG: potassium channel family protein [Candidatus Zixiibacteriota bacterium]